MLLVYGAKEYVFIPVTGPAGVDLTVFTVQMALIPETQSEPSSGDWVPAAWLAPTAGAAKEVALLIDSTTYNRGEYMAYAQVAAAPELVVLCGGRVRIGDAR